MVAAVRTDTLAGMTCEVVTYPGHHGDRIDGYVARPAGPGPFPAIVVVHHMPGWDEWNWETTRRFAQHGYLAICPNLYVRAGHGTPEDVAAVVRSQGGVADDQVVGDVEGAINWARSRPEATGKVALFGTCSAGRHVFLAACRLGDAVDAAIECWGGNVVQAPEALRPNQPVSPHTLTAQIQAPLLGLFGNEDRSPTPEQVDQHEEELKKHGKPYEFHRYDGAGHGFMYYDRPAYRQEQAVDAWGKVWDFLGRTLT
jgi:carboxymethylenebutenolidase